MPRTSLRRRLAAALVVVLAALSLGLAGAAPASAHTELVSVSPGTGERVVVGAPLTVALRFTDAIDPALTHLVVVDAAGDVVGTGPVAVDGATVTTVTTDVPEPGEYVVRFRVVSGDGHPVDGESAFRVAAPRPAKAEGKGEGKAGRAGTAPASDEPPSSGTDAEVATAATLDESAGTVEAAAADGSEDGNDGMLLALGLVVTLGGVVMLVPVARRRARAGARTR